MDDLTPAKIINTALEVRYNYKPNWSNEIIAALDAAGLEIRPKVPDGYVIVPREPRSEMLKAAVEESEQIQSDPCPFWRHEFIPIYRAMIAAAPNAKKPPQPEG